MSTLYVTVSSFSNGYTSVYIDIIFDGYFKNLFYFKGATAYHHGALKIRKNLKDFIKDLNHSNVDYDVHFYNYSKKEILEILNNPTTELI